MTLLTPNLPVQQIFSAATKNVLSIRQSSPDLFEDIVAFKRDCLPNAKFDVYHSSVVLTAKATTVTLRRSRDDVELVIDRRLRSGGWKSEVISTKASIRSKLNSLRETSK